MTRQIKKHNFKTRGRQVLNRKPVDDNINNLYDSGNDLMLDGRNFWQIISGESTLMKALWNSITY